MDVNQLALSPDAYSAWLLRQVIEDTTPASETSSEAHTRAGAIIEMFKAMAPRDPVEAMIASHCIQLRFSARAAMRDAEAPGQDAKTQKAARASAVSVSRELRVWHDKLEKMQARADAAASKEAAEAAKRAERAAAPPNPPAEPRTPPPAETRQSVPAQTMKRPPSPELSDIAPVRGAVAEAARSGVSAALPPRSGGQAAPVGERPTDPRLSIAAAPARAASGPTEPASGLAPVQATSPKT